MNDLPQDTSAQLSEESAAELLTALLHKQGNWVEWGKACQKLQKAGYTSQKIFEETGFQGSQQNLIIVASQVYESIVKAGVAEEVSSYFLGPKSDILYEFRILNEEQRAAAAQLTFKKKLELDEAKEVAKAVKEFSRLSQLPSGFTNHPGDAVAYQYWRGAKQKKDLSARARLIAVGLKFAHSQSAREAIENLLSDFSNTAATPKVKAPLMPIYRLELEEELPRIIPIVGNLPLTSADLESVPSLVIQEPFRLVEITQKVTVMPIPGWQTILKAEDPVGIFTTSDRLPSPLPGKPEIVLVVVDRQIRQWDVSSYFTVEQEGQLTFDWFEQSPSVPILGQVILVLRPKSIIDENVITQPWQMDD